MKKIEKVGEKLVGKRGQIRREIEKNQNFQNLDIKVTPFKNP